MANYLYEITFDDVKRTEIVTQPIPNLNGIKNTLLSTQDANKVSFLKSEIEAGCKVPFHKADYVVLLYFTCGSGKAVIQEENGEETRLDISAGDVIIYYPPMKLHGYEVGGEGLEYFAVSLPA